MGLYRINGYWKDTKEEFTNRIVSSSLYSYCPDEEIFFYFASLDELRRNFEGNPGNVEEFAITDLTPMKYKVS